MSEITYFAAIILIDELREENVNLTARIAELEGFIKRLIEAGNAVCDAYPAWISPIGKWDALVKDWKEREE